MGCFQGAIVYAVHLWHIPLVLDPILWVLLRKFSRLSPNRATLTNPTGLQIQVYASKELGLSQGAAVNLLITINACGIPIRAPCGYLADRYIGPLNCLIPWVALCGILMFCWAAVDSIAGLYVFAVFYGLASAAAMGLFAGTVPSLTKDLDKIGTRVGMVLTLMSLGPLTGPPVAGALIQRSGGNYIASQIWAGISLLVSVLALLGARVIRTGLSLDVKI